VRSSSLSLILLAGCGPCTPDDSGPARHSGDTQAPDSPPGDSDSGQVETGPPDDTGDTGDPSVEDADGDGWTTGDGDCDDSDAAVNPAAVEVSGDGIDQDCDGYVDLDAMTAWDADLYWVGTESSSTWAWLGMQGLAVLPDLDGDGGAELAASTSYAVHVLQSALISDQQLAYVEGQPLTSIGPLDPDDPLDDYWPRGLACGEDIDGDGSQDLAIIMGQGFEDLDELALFDAASLALGGSLHRDDALLHVHLEEYYSTGRNLLWSADYDGDGLNDLVLGEPYASWESEHTAGRVRIFGAELTLGADLLEADATVTILGDTEVDHWTGMYCHDLGDVDGDGTADLLVAAGRNSGVLSGAELASHDGMQRLDVALTTIDHGDTAWTDEGLSPGDLDGDGRDDVLLFDREDDIDIDGLYMGGRIDLFMDLGAGGTLTYWEADAHLYVSETSHGITGMAGPARLRDEGTDLLVAGYLGVALLPIEQLPLEGLVDLAAWPDRIDGEGTWFHYLNKRGDNLLAADLDGDGYDDVVAGDPYLAPGFEEGTDPYSSAGVISLFLNPID